MSPWLRRTLTKGYALQFLLAPPPFTGVPPYVRQRKEVETVLQDGLSDLLAKGAVSLVPPQEAASGSYHRYFAVPKKGGSMRPILDLRRLNLCLAKIPFVMLSARRLFTAIRPGDFFTSVDLKDAFFHVPVVPRHRKYLRFNFRGKVYQYCVLPFGMALSPRTFTVLVETALAPIRQKGVRVFSYLDDILIVADSRDLAVTHTSLVIDHPLTLGFLINWTKSSLSPSQVTTYLGIELNSVSMLCRPSPERRSRIRRIVSTARAGTTVSVNQCSVVLGLMASVVHLVPLGRLHMRPFQRWFLSHRMDPALHRNVRIPMTKRAYSALVPWLDSNLYESGVPMGPVLLRRVICTDASLTGWGASAKVNPRTGRGPRASHGT